MQKLQWIWATITKVANRKFHLTDSPRFSPLSVDTLSAKTQWTLLYFKDDNHGACFKSYLFDGGSAMSLLVFLFGRLPGLGAPCW